MNMKKLLPMLVLSVVGIASALPSRADDVSGVFTFQGGQFTVLSSSPPGLTNPSRIDNAGDFLVAGADGQPYLIHNGTATPVSLPGPGATFDTSISSNGTILGRYVQFTSTYFLERNGSVTFLPGATGFFQSVNNAGIVVATSFDGQFQQMYDTASGNITNISFPGAKNTVLVAINDNNQILGQAGHTVFIWDAGTFTILPIPANCGPVDMNNSEQVVGDCFNGHFGEGFLYSSGVMTFINFNLNSNTNETDLTGINDSGEVVGVFSDVPEPPASVQLLSGLMLMLGLARVGRKR